MLSPSPTVSRRQRAPAWPPASGMVQRVGPMWAGGKRFELTKPGPLRPTGLQPSAELIATHAPTLPERPVC